MKLITLDFETYWGPRCDIKSLGISQYVQHPEFQILSVAIKTPAMKRAKFIGGPRKVRAFFDQLKPHAADLAICAHNQYFDAYVASYHYNFLPRFLLCTYSMAQPLHAPFRSTSLASLSKYYELPQLKLEMPNIYGKRWEDLTFEEISALKKYNIVDTNNAELLLKRMYPGFPREELKLIDLTLRKFVEPTLVIDVPKAVKLIRKEEKEKKAALKKAGISAEEARSEAKFAEVLAERGYECPMKWSDKKKKMIPALAQSDLPFQAMRDSEDKELRTLIAARIRSRTSIVETRAKAMVKRSKAPVPIYILYCGAHTMRFAGGDRFNPQNLPREGELRHCLRAPEGSVLVVVDASSIEARDTATFCKQENLLDEFRSNADVYRNFAKDLYGVDDISDEQRFVGKTCILALQYQVGAYKLRLTLEIGMHGPAVVIDMEESQRAVNLYRRKFNNIPKTWRELQQMLNCLLETGRETEYNGLVFRPNGSILMPNGLSLWYPDIGFSIGEYGTAEFHYKPYSARRRRKEITNLYGGKTLENIIQCRSRIMTTTHMLKLSNYYKVVLMSHDEIVMCVPTKKAEACLQDAIEIMSEPPSWNERCPLAAKGVISEHYLKA